MKVMIRRGDKGLSAYVPKKDLEEPIVADGARDACGAARSRCATVGR